MKKVKKLHCPKCIKYTTCIELCEEAENYVNQDYVSVRNEDISMGDLSEEEKEEITRTGI